MLLAFGGILAKSKCSRIRCCWVEIERDVNAEVTLEQAEIRARNRNNSLLGSQRTEAAGRQNTFSAAPSPAGLARNSFDTPAQASLTTSRNGSETSEREQMVGFNLSLNSV